MWLFCDVNNLDLLRVKLFGKFWVELFFLLSFFNFCLDFFLVLFSIGVLFELVVKWFLLGIKCFLGCGLVMEVVEVIDLI